MEFKIGQKFKILEKHNFNYFKKGDIIKVVELTNRGVPKFVCDDPNRQEIKYFVDINSLINKKIIELCSEMCVCGKHEIDGERNEKDKYSQHNQWMTKNGNESVLTTLVGIGIDRKEEIITVEAYNPYCNNNF